MGTPNIIQTRGSLADRLTFDTWGLEGELRDPPTLGQSPWSLLGLAVEGLAHHLSGRFLHLPQIDLADPRALAPAMSSAWKSPFSRASPGWFLLFLWAQPKCPLFSEAVQTPLYPPFHQAHPNPVCFHHTGVAVGHPSFLCWLVGWFSLPQVQGPCLDGLLGKFPKLTFVNWIKECVPSPLPSQKR